MPGSSRVWERACLEVAPVPLYAGDFAAPQPRGGRRH
jgi:hypothetical protein